VRGVHYVLIFIIVLAFFGGFPAYMAWGQVGGSQSVTITVTAQPVFGPPPEGVGVGWDGGVAGEDEACPVGGTSIFGRLTPGGLAIEPITVVSFDERFCLTIDAGTYLLFPYVAFPSCIGIYEKTTQEPSPPQGACFISCMYDAFPDGTFFIPPATLQCCYDPSEIPEGIAGDCLGIGCCDHTSDQWIELDCVIDTEANIITAEISQFFDPVLLGYEPMPPGAAFEISSLNISPTEVEIGETVNVAVLVANTGGQSGSYRVVLKIADVAEAERQVFMNAGASQQVNFATSQDTPGLYLVDVNGLTGSFEVIEPLAPEEPVNWWLIGGIIAAVVIIVFVTFILRRMMLS